MGAMGIIKEYRIVMPVTVQEYRVAQIYMTARTQAMEAEQVRRLRFRKACSSSSNRAGCLQHSPAPGSPGTDLPDGCPLA